MAGKKNMMPRYMVKVNGSVVPLRPLVGNRYSSTVRPYIALTHCAWEVFSRKGMDGLKKCMPGLDGMMFVDERAALKKVADGKGKITITRDDGAPFDARFEVEAGTGIERVWLGKHQAYYIIGQAAGDSSRRVVINVRSNDAVNALVDKGMNIKIDKDTIEVVKK